MFWLVSKRAVCSAFYSLCETVVQFAIFHPLAFNVLKASLFTSWGFLYTLIALMISVLNKLVLPGENSVLFRLNSVVLHHPMPTSKRELFLCGIVINQALLSRIKAVFQHRRPHVAVSAPARGKSSLFWWSFRKSKADDVIYPTPL